MKRELLHFLQQCARCGQRATAKPHPGAATVEEAVADGIADFRQYVHDEDAESAGIAAALVELCDARGTSPN
jgi:hypothetical protein